MRKMEIVFLPIWMLLHAQLAMGQVPVEKVNGTWMGSLEVSATSLRIVFNVSADDQGLLSATLDSPDQGARGIEMGEVTLYGDSLTINAPAIMGRYQGRIASDTTIEGTWVQAGRSFPLNLQKQESELVINRPQEPHPPYPYKEEEVTFPNEVDRFTLAGTLTLPSEGGPFPGVILVTGSGSQNRDEEIFGHKPFKVLADFLTRNGIVVLRYDDRGVGASGGSGAGITTEDNATDALAAFRYLSKRKEVDPENTGILGHSEGGLIAMMIASGNDEVDFIISLAGPGVDGKTILLDQSEYISTMSGITDSVVKDNRVVMDRVYDLVASNENHGEWAEEVLEFTRKHYESWVSEEFTTDDIERISRNLVSSISTLSYPWMRYFILSDPSGWLRNINCPVLALNGEKDSQVLAEKNIAAIRQVLTDSGNRDVTSRIIPGLNHLFQPCDTGLPAEYGSIETTFDPETLEVIAMWIQQL